MSFAFVSLGCASLPTICARMDVCAWACAESGAYVESSRKRFLFAHQQISSRLHACGLGAHEPRIAPVHCGSLARCLRTQL